MKRLGLMLIGLMLVLVVTRQIAAESRGGVDARLETAVLVGNEPVELTETGQLPDRELVTHVVTHNDYSYVGRGGELTVVEMSDPLHPTVVNRVPLVMVDGVSPLFPNTMSLVGDVLYIGRGCYLYLFDLSDPASPQQTTVLQAGCQSAVYIAVRPTALVDNILYVPFGYMFAVVDVSQPLAPVLLTTVSFPTDITAQSFVVDGDRAYAFLKDRIEVFDVSTPATPSLLTTLDEGRGGLDATVVDGYAYFMDWDGPQLLIMDVRDLNNIAVVGGINVAATIEAVVDGYLYVSIPANYWGVIDVHDPHNPVATWTAAPPFWVNEVAFTGSTMVVGSEAGLHLFDVSTPTQPELISHIAEHHAEDVAEMVFVEDKLYVANRFRGLAVLDVSDGVETTAVRYTGHYETLVVEGDYAYMGSWYGLGIFDISDPYWPTEVMQHFPVNGETLHHLAVKNGIVFGAADKILSVIDASQPEQPVLMTEYGFFGVINDVMLVGDTLFVVDEVSGLTILDVSVPATPQAVSQTAVVGLAQSVAVLDGHAYVSSDSTVYSFDVTNMNQPQLVGQITPYPRRYSSYGGSNVYMRAVPPHMLYVVNSSWDMNEHSGLGVINVANPAEPTLVGFDQGWYQRLAAGDHVAYVWGHDYIKELGVSFHVQGRVQDGGGHGVADVSLQLSDGAVVTSDATGLYDFSGVAAGHYTVTPTLDGFVMMPPAQTVTVPAGERLSPFTVLPTAKAVSLAPDSSSEATIAGARGQLLTIMAPTGTVTTAVTLHVTPTVAPRHLATAGYSFEVAVDDGEIAFNNPLSVTLLYDDLDVRVGDEMTLNLYRWQDGAWHVVDCGVPPVRLIEENRLDVALCEVGQYAIGRATNTTFMPMMMAERTAVGMSGTVRLTAVHSGLCLWDTWQDYCGREGSGEWSLVSVANDIFLLQNEATNNCLTVPNASMEAGAMTALALCTGEGGQLWRMESVGNYTQLVALHSEMCLDIYTGNVDRALPAIQWPCTGTQNQLWHISEYSQ